MKKNVYIIPNAKKEEIVNHLLSGKFKRYEGPKRNIEKPAKIGQITNNNFLETCPNKCSNKIQHPRYAIELTTKTYPTLSVSTPLETRLIEINPS